MLRPASTKSCSVKQEQMAVNYKISAIQPIKLTTLKSGLIKCEVVQGKTSPVEYKVPTLSQIGLYTRSCIRSHQIYASSYTKFQTGLVQTLKQSVLQKFS